MAAVMIECPLCQRSRKAWKKTIYGHTVCRQCYYAFANRRQGAYLIDYLIWQVVMLGVGYVVGVAFRSMGMPLTRQKSWVLDLISWVMFLVFCMKDGMAGYSPGKWLCGVRAVDSVTGKPLEPRASLKRNLPLIIPFVMLVVAYQLCRGHRIGDKWSRSKVIWVKYAGSHVFGGEGLCEQCQYDLYGNRSGVCPECGRAVSERNRVFNETRAAAEAALGEGAVGVK